jgi:small subunit ribosomal protein S20
LANTKSALKHARQNEGRRLRNRVYRSGARTQVKVARHTIEGGEPEAAQGAVAVAIKALDKAVQKGILHKNNAARRKSRLLKLLHRSTPNA